ncbi:hypothetical protein [Pseudonocardia broussonetiae]|uniref:Uncharacterized protein n=1 Tax=Pseudonocardia broussonetiae TaxID=2736640 RepID=A0A6M6JIA9_9PSEU|nr:hypothetical protein [Pseudonocardia broussonetiae]QJY46647.1 hypothetical protein HOP40_13155 [Pseudonocardia broussonetiae]
MSNQQATVSPERIVAILQRTELGAAMWRAATYEAISEVQAERISELERQHGPAADEGSPAATDV